MIATLPSLRAPRWSSSSRSQPCRRRGRSSRDGDASDDDDARDSFEAAESESGEGEFGLDRESCRHGCRHINRGGRGSARGGERMHQGPGGGVVCGLPMEAGATRRVDLRRTRWTFATQAWRRTSWISRDRDGPLVLGRAGGRELVRGTTRGLIQSRADQKARGSSDKLGYPRDHRLG